tara:strand:+ start:170 stop:553 length:384 start_codon:yes stop_codon:yes gene_type:complete
MKAIELYRGGSNDPTQSPPFHHAQGQLPFNLAWFTSDHSLAACYGPVNDYAVTLHNVKEVTREEWGAFDRVMLFVNPQPALDAKEQGYDAVRCRFTSGMDAILVLGVSSENCRNDGPTLYFEEYEEE